MKSKKPQYIWDEETGVASCILYDGNDVYVGTATCHPDSFDMKSEKIGLTIAQMRAEIKALNNYKNNLKAGYAALKQLYYSINQSQKWNPESYESRMIVRQMQLKQLDITTINEEIQDRKHNLKQYITDHFNFQQKIRAKRKMDKTE